MKQLYTSSFTTAHFPACVIPFNTVIPNAVRDLIIKYTDASFVSMTMRVSGFLLRRNDSNNKQIPRCAPYSLCHSDEGGISTFNKQIPRCARNDKNNRRIPRYARNDSEKQNDSVVNLSIFNHSIIQFTTHNSQLIIHNS